MMSAAQTESQVPQAVEQARPDERGKINYRVWEILSGGRGISAA
jgi:hypothetical protein